MLNTKVTNGDYYACTDSGKLYKDTSDNILDRRLVKAIMISTENERLYKIKPISGRLYYVWETNDLWVYDYGWKLKLGSDRENNGYIYSNGVLTGVSKKSTTNNILDNNGLLEDGSVVIRDINRIIKGKLYTDLDNNNLVISSYLGGGFTILPNGDLNSLGYLRIYNETKEEPYYNNTTREVTRAIGWFDGEWNTNDDMYVNLDGGYVDPTILPLDHDIIKLATFTEREFIEKDTGNSYILRNDYEITIRSDGTVEVELTLTDNSNKSVSVEVIDANDNVSTELVPSGTVISKTKLSATRTITDDGNLLITTEDNIKITFISNDKASEVYNYNVIVDYENVDIGDVDDRYGDTNYRINTHGQSKLYHRYLLWHEGNFDFDKYITPTKILNVLQQNDPPLDLTVMYLGELDKDNNLVKYTPSDFALKVHKHLAGSFNSKTGIYVEEDIIDFDKVAYKILKKVVDKGAEEGVQLGATLTMPEYTSSRTLEDLYLKIQTNIARFTVRDRGIGSDTVDKDGNKVNPKIGEFSVDLSKANSTIYLDISPYGHHHDISQMDGYDEFIAKFDEYVPLADTSTITEGSIAGKTDADRLIYTNKDGKIPADITGTSQNTKMLDHPVDIVINDMGLVNLSDKSIGSAQDVTFDDNTVDINITINGDGHKHNRYVLAEGVNRDPNEEGNDQAGVTIPTLDPATKIIKDIYLPDYVKDSMLYAGEFDPNDGYPIPKKVGATYSASACGYPSDLSTAEYIKTGDLIVYVGGEDESWIILRNGQTEDSISYEFNKIPLNPGFYTAIPNSNVSPMTGDYKWSVLVTKSSNLTYQQIAISGTSLYSRDVSQTTKIEPIMGVDSTTGDPVQIGTKTVRDSIVYGNWLPIGSMPVTIDSVLIESNSWNDVTTDEYHPLYKSEITISNSLSNIIDSNTRYNIYNMNSSQLNTLEAAGVTRMYIVNENGTPNLYSEMAIPDIDIILQIEIVPSRYTMQNSSL